MKNDIYILKKMYLKMETEKLIIWKKNKKYKKRGRAARIKQKILKNILQFI